MQNIRKIKIECFPSKRKTRFSFHALHLTWTRADSNQFLIGSIHWKGFLSILCSIIAFSFKYNCARDTTIGRLSNLLVNEQLQDFFMLLEPIAAHFWLFRLEIFSSFPLQIDLELFSKETNEITTHYGHLFSDLVWRKISRHLMQVYILFFFLNMRYRVACFTNCYHGLMERPDSGFYKKLHSKQE